MFGEEHPEIADALFNVGTLLSAQEKHEEARRVDERALAIDEKTLGEHHPKTERLR